MERIKRKICGKNYRDVPLTQAQCKWIIKALQHDLNCNAIPHSVAHDLAKRIVGQITDVYPNAFTDIHKV
ncbi:MAG: hypothetical protein AB1457_18210 [Chloroflexota bacterium]